MNKEIVFVGRMQNKTRDYIHNLEREVKLLQQENNQLKEQLKDEEEHRIKIAKDREQTYKECLLLIEQKKELRSWLEEMLDDENDIFSVVRIKDVLSKLNELEGKNE